jgi:hypothetical protein
LSACVFLLPHAWDLSCTFHRRRFEDPNDIWCRSQWPRGLRHEMSSPAWTLGSWVRIPLEAWMFAFILFVLSCVSSGLATGWPLVQGVLPISVRLRNLARGGKRHWLDEYELWSPSLRIFFLRTYFSNSFNLCSSLSLTGQVSHSYKIRTEITVLYILFIL